LSARAESIITAGLRPEYFAERGMVSLSRTLVITLLSVLVITGFGFRITGLSSEGLGEDELNKLQAVADYRQRGLTSANGEHPLLMKALQTASLFTAEKWNSSFAAANPQWSVAPEAALRFPSTVFGTFTIVLIYFLATELFGAEVGLIAAALWAFDPNAIGFNRIAKEDTFLLFFFLLANIFWLKGQRVAEGGSSKNPERYYWATAAAFGGMLASKYLPQLIAISIAYYWLFQRIPATQWRLGKKRILTFFVLMGVVFILLNPPILFPATWTVMKQFAGQKLVGHDAYEFMGKLYSHKMTDWLNGTPWYLYYVFFLVKLPLLTLAGFLIGLPLLFRRKLGDGRYFILLWMFIWVMTFSFAGGKFTRYLTVVLPAVLITAAIGLQTVGGWLAERFWPSAAAARAYARTGIAVLAVAASAYAAVTFAPHFRLYTNALGGGVSNAGYYFPHDEFYDASMREAVFDIAREARTGAHVASETPSVVSYYAERIGRQDLVAVTLSDPDALKQMSDGDYLVISRGRRYFSNDALLTALRGSATPDLKLTLGSVPSADVYRVNQRTLGIITETAKRLPPLVHNFNLFRTGLVHN
jgi:Dolichyl-phosphate-mannose-protein mannosyltransferase